MDRANCRAKIGRHRGLVCKGSGGPLGGNNQQTDFTKFFEESQNNIMRLNQSRLNALAELKSARQRIAELEQRLGEATDQLNSVTHPGHGHHQGNTHYNQGDFLGHGQGGWSPTQREQARITIGYSTGWKQVYIHYRSQSQGWTNIPGVRLQPGSGSLAGHQVAILSTTERIEFVMNNGEGSWDTPGYSGSGKNYVVEGPGDYFLKSGKVQRLH